MLKIVHIGILIFSVFSAAAQQESPPTNNNVNNAPLNGEYKYSNSMEETESLDTVTVEKKVQSVEPPSVDKGRKFKQTRTRSIESAPVMNKKSEEVTEKEVSTTGGIAADEVVAEPQSAYQSAPGYQQANYEFNYSKSQASHQPMQRTPSREQQKEMDEAVGYFATNAPNSFEYHYFKYTSGNYDVSRIENLREAQKRMPENSDVHAQLAAYNIITREEDSAGFYINKLMNSGRLNVNTLLYAEDLLLSVPEDGVLITHGFDDTYSAWQKQHADGVREDVTLISLDFLQSDYYRTLLKEDGFKFPEQDVIDVNYLKAFCELNASKAISISMTAPKEYFLPIQKKLYVTGLVFEYHQDTFNNFERNDELWNSDLSKHLIDEAKDEKSKQLSANYLPMLLQLRKVYGQQQNKQKVKEIDKAIDKVSLQCRKYDQVQKLKSSY